MDIHEYRKRGKEMVDYIADYLENIRDRRVFPDVNPGYMHNLLPESAPVDGENWENIFNDIERVIMPGVTHWQSPHMHAYFPALNSFPSMLGDMLADAINCLGFTWASSPACTELETIVLNWLGKMIGLPNEFLHLNSTSKGGGVIQTTASESTLVCLLAGRTQAIKKFHEQTPGYQDAEINARLVAYCSDQAHSSVEKAALIGLVRMRYIESNENLLMRGQPLKEAIENDIKQGLIPFWVCCTLGTTGACAFDNLDEIGDVCLEFGLWLHIDAAYAGSALICPEYRSWLKGIEKANSISFNPSKWLMVHFDCTAMWVKDSTAVHRTFNVEPLYLQHENSGLAIDYMHWQIPLSKRFRSLKLWFVLRSFGIRGLQKHIREGVRLAQKFEALVLADHRFEIPAKRHLGMVVFRIKGENELTEKLLKRLNHRGKLHCVPASLKGKYVIRFTVTSTQTTIEDILEDWNEIKVVTSELLEEMNVKIDRIKVSLKDTREKNEAFGSSLLLSNSPMSPKVVNGSFAAIFDADEFLAKTYAGIRIANPTLHTKLPPLRPLIKRPTNFTNFQHQDSPSMRRRVRGILMSGKQFSLDSGMDLVVQSCYDSNIEQTQPNSIREDSEDILEVYESLGTPPATPPPRISPMVNRHSLQQLKQQKLTDTKLLLKSSAKSAIQPTTQTKSFTLEILEPTQVSNKYKMANNCKLLSSNSVRKPFRQEKTATKDFKTKLFSFNNNFDDKILSDIIKKSSNVDNTCSNCNISLNFSNNDISEEPDKNNEYGSNFKSTVNTVIFKQKINSNHHKKNLTQHSKSKSKCYASNSTLSEKEMYFGDTEAMLTNKIKSPLNQKPDLSLNSHVYHGKKFLEQSSSEGILSFYNIALKSVNPYRRRSSMSDISEEEISIYEWDTVQSNFNSQSPLTLPVPRCRNFKNSKLLNKSKSSSLETELHNDIDISPKNNLNEDIKTDNNKDVVNYNNEKLIFQTREQSASSSFPAELNIRITNERKPIETSFESSIDICAKQDTEDEQNYKNSNKDNPLQNLCEYNKREEKSDVGSDKSSNESKNDTQHQRHFHDTTTESSTTNSPTSGFSYPASLWSSLEVAELLSHSSSTKQLFGDSWAVVSDVNKKENSENSDFCKKCGHNSIATPSNDLADNNHYQNNNYNKLNNIYQNKSINCTKKKINRTDSYEKDIISENVHKNYDSDDSDNEAST